MLKKHPLMARLLLLVIVPLLAVICVVWLQMRASLPDVQGVVALQGVHDTVRIARDRLGVPHIEARSDRDAYFAMGYLHAQDRMWQLEVQRRIAAGRLSEIFGKGSVEQDIWFRTLGLRRAAESDWKALSPSAKLSLRAYADGVNSWLSEHDALPPEFNMLGLTPEPWTVYDSLSWIKVFALNLGGNYRREIERLLASRHLDSPLLKALFPAYPDDSYLTVADLGSGGAGQLAELVDLQRRIEADFRIGGEYVGSNAWAVSGKLTDSGAAFLANDPHLGLQIPSLWYMASIEGGELHAQGATLVGLPVVIFGRNRNIAWGGTNLMADVQDIYFEAVNPNNVHQYDGGGNWVDFKEREESIIIKQDFPAFLRPPLRPVKIRVRQSRHGPIISDQFQVFDQVAALRWTALELGDTSYEAFYRLGYARDWPSFNDALSHHVAPALNLLYADREGNIGYIAAGAIPVRKQGEGSLPVPGWSGDHEWAGVIPFEELPRSFNPESGFIVSANNKAIGEDYPYLITHDWAPPARAERIASLLREGLAERGRLSLEGMRNIQADIRSEPSRRLLARLLEHVPSNDQQRRAFKYLSDWQGSMTMDSQAATIFNVWMRFLKSELFQDELRAYWNQQRDRRYLKGVAADVDVDSLYRVLTDSSGRWCDDVGTPERETCDDVLDSSLNDALWEVLKITGDESMEAWHWGELHRTVYGHVPFSNENALRSIFERSIGNGGSPDTVNVAPYAYRKSNGYSQDFGASFRQIIAMGRNIRHRYMNSTGQSGNVMSPHYDDMIRDFRDVRFADFDHSEEFVTVLELTPEEKAEQGAQP